MKSRIPKPAKALLLTALALFIASSPGHTALLFQETWNDLAAGEAAVSSQRWVMTQGLESQFVKTIDPAPSLAGHWITPVYGGTNSVVLPQMQTASAFEMPAEGIDLSIQIAFTNASSNGYFRIGLVAADHALHNYWFEVRKGLLKIDKRSGSGTPLTLSTYTLDASAWPLSQDATFSLQITPGKSGGKVLSLLMNGTLLVSLEDTASLPDFGDGFHLFVATRDNQAGIIGEVSLHSIPEGKAATLIFSGVVLLAAWNRKRKTLP